MSPLSPKATFLSDAKQAGAWQDIVSNPLFKKAVEAAMLSYTLRITGDIKSEGIALQLVGKKIEGAKGVLEELATIGKLVKPDITEGSDELEPI